MVCRRRLGEEAAGVFVGLEQRLDPCPPGGIAAARAFEVRDPRRRVGQIEDGQEDVSFGHGSNPRDSRPPLCGVTGGFRRSAARWECRGAAKTVRHAAGRRTRLL